MHRRSSIGQTGRPAVGRGREYPSFSRTIPFQRRGADGSVGRNGQPCRLGAALDAPVGVASGPMIVTRQPSPALRAGPRRARTCRRTPASTITSVRSAVPHSAQGRETVASSALCRYSVPAAAKRGIMSASRTAAVEGGFVRDTRQMQCYPDRPRMGLQVSGLTRRGPCTLDRPTAELVDEV